MKIDNKKLKLIYVFTFLINLKYYKISFLDCIILRKIYYSYLLEAFKCKIDIYIYCNLIEHDKFSVVIMKNNI